MFYDEQVTYVGLSFENSVDAVNAYKALHKFMEEKKIDHEYFSLSIHKSSEEHICASKDGFCNHITWNFDDFSDPPKGKTESDLRELFSEIGIKGANIALSSKKEMKLEDFLKS